VRQSTIRSIRQFAVRGRYAALGLLLFAFAATRLLGQAPQHPGIPILAYHRFDPLKPGSTTVTTATLLSQLSWIVEHHYTVVPLATVIQTVQGNSPAPLNMIAITVDDGHISVYTILFPIIQKYRIPITLFIYPSAISKASYALTWDQLKQMKASGLVDIQAHTYWHPDFRKEKARLRPADYNQFVSNQLLRSKAVLEQQLGSPITVMAWPYGIYDHDLEQAAARAGYTASFAYAGGVALPGDDPFAIPRIPAANYAHGNAFATLLEDAQAHPNGSSIGHE
jgi:peptidoglycan/xylan/chitin deacetylase (PgdA/CDA1 family)